MTAKGLGQRRFVSCSQPLIEKSTATAAVAQGSQIDLLTLVQPPPPQGGASSLDMSNSMTCLPVISFGSSVLGPSDCLRWRKQGRREVGISTAASRRWYTAASSSTWL